MQFVVKPNQHAKETTIVEAEDSTKALEIAQALYGKDVTVELTEEYF